MAPTRRTTRQSLNASYDLEAQIREYQRYEQELEDRILASNMQREYDERRNPPAPVVHPIPQQGPIVPRERTPPTNRASVDNADEIPPPSPILAGAPRIQRRLNEENNGNRVSIVASRPSTSLPRRPRRGGRGSRYISNRTLVALVTEGRIAPRIMLPGIFGRDSDDSSESSDNESDSSDDDVVVLPTSSNHPTNSRNDDSSSSSSSGDSTSSVRTTRSSNRSVVIHSNSGNPITVSSISTVSSNASGPSRQALVDNDDQMYQQEYEPIDNQPSTSQAIPIALNRKGNPDPTWGDCTMCFEVPIRPQGCCRCYQLIGCKTCVDGWHKTAQHPSCPLCRRKWGRQPDVATMPTIDSRRRSQAARRSRVHRTQSDNSRA
ncbi:unnamed protein product [Caenorhabditis brenneri]